MSTSLFSRTFFLAAALLAGGVGMPGDARAQLNLGPVIDRSVRLSSPAGFSPRGLPDRVTMPDGEPNPRVAQADCSGAAAQAAAESGGQVLSVQSRQQGGRTVCVVTVLVPGEGGGRPRKRTITIPQ